MIEKITFFKGRGVEGDPGRIAAFFQAISEVNGLIRWFLERQYVHPVNWTDSLNQPINDLYGGNAEGIYYALSSGRRIEIRLSIKGWSDDLNIQITIFGKAKNVLADIRGDLVSSRNGNGFRAYDCRFEFGSATF